MPILKISGRPPEGSWHADYRDTAYIYIGGLSFDLSEGDIITIFSQFGEPVYINLVRDKETGKSKGFAFLKYEDQRSTDLAVDNLGGATVLGRVLKVDHTRYKQREDEDIKDNTRGSSKSESEGESQEDSGRIHRQRKHVGDKENKYGGEGVPMLKEEMELQALIRSHDEDDPMKDYLVRQKREELAEAKDRATKKVSRYENSESKKSLQSRHHSRKNDRPSTRDR